VRGVHIVRRAGWAAVLLTLIMIVAAEGGAWVAAERFREGLGAMDGPALAARRREYDAIRDWGMFDTGLRLRVNPALRQRLLTLADFVIADYRRDDPSMSVADWREAKAALDWALTLSPGDRQVRARQLIAEGHLLRFSARSQRRGSDASRQAYQNAIDRFEEAAKLDERSYDPYLGISNIQSYALDDVDRAADAIDRAEARGYKPGRRERAQLGDGYLRRADRTRRHARTLEDESMRTELEKARGDYERCVERFEPIQDFGRSAFNMEYCRAHLARITLELAVEPEFQWMQQ
jgi:tetratricopeptide (TPR) repeat protein